MEDPGLAAVSAAEATVGDLILEEALDPATTEEDTEEDTEVAAEITNSPSPPTEEAELPGLKIRASTADPSSPSLRTPRSSARSTLTFLALGQ